MLWAPASDWMPTPGATTSGLAARSTGVGPRELKGATPASPRRRLSLSLLGATVSTPGAACGRRERVVVVGLLDLGPDRQVDHADVVLPARRDGVIDRRDDVADVAVARAAEDFSRGDGGAGPAPAGRGGRPPARWGRRPPPPRGSRGPPPPPPPPSHPGPAREIRRGRPP